MNTNNEFASPTPIQNTENAIHIVENQNASERSSLQQTLDDEYYKRIREEHNNRSNVMDESKTPIRGTNTRNINTESFLLDNSNISIALDQDDVLDDSDIGEATIHPADPPDLAGTRL